MRLVKHFDELQQRAMREVMDTKQPLELRMMWLGKHDAYAESWRLLAEHRGHDYSEAGDMPDQAGDALGMVDRELSKASRPPPVPHPDQSPSVGIGPWPESSHCGDCGDCFTFGFWHRITKGHWPT